MEDTLVRKSLVHQTKKFHGTNEDEALKILCQDLTEGVWSGGPISGEDFREELLNQAGPVIPSATCEEVYSVIEPSLHFGSTKIRETIQKYYGDKGSGTKIGFSVGLDVSPFYDIILAYQLSEPVISKSSQEIADRKPDRIFKTKSDGTMTIQLKHRVVEVRPISVPIVALSEDQIKQVLQPPQLKCLESVDVSKIPGISTTCKKTLAVNKVAEHQQIKMARPKSNNKSYNNQQQTNEISGLEYLLDEKPIYSMPAKNRKRVTTDIKTEKTQTGNYSHKRSENMDLQAKAVGVHPPPIVKVVIPNKKIYRKNKKVVEKVCPSIPPKRIIIRKTNSQIEEGKQVFKYEVIGGLEETDLGDGRLKKTRKAKVAHSGVDPKMKPNLSAGTSRDKRVKKRKKSVPLAPPTPAHVSSFHGTDRQVKRFKPSYIYRNQFGKGKPKFPPGYRIPRKTTEEGEIPPKLEENIPTSSSTSNHKNGDTIEPVLTVSASKSLETVSQFPNENDKIQGHGTVTFGTIKMKEIAKTLAYLTNSIVVRNADQSTTLQTEEVYDSDEVFTFPEIEMDMESILSDISPPDPDDFSESFLAHVRAMEMLFFGDASEVDPGASVSGGVTKEDTSTTPVDDADDLDILQLYVDQNDEFLL